jgi:simple sugar transport system substrate-binding protein
MKILRAFIICISVLCLFACSRAVSEEDGSFEELIVVGFSQVGAESDWRAANTMSMQSALSDENGYRLIFDDAQQKQERQINAIRSFIQQNVDYIVLAPTTEQGWDTVLKEAQTAGIPVIIIDRMIEAEDDSLFTCWIGSDFKKEGDKAVSWLEEKFGSEPVKIIHLQGNIGSSAQIGRTNGLDDGIRRNPNWTLVARDSGEFTQAKAQELMWQYADLDFNVVYAENDNMAYGAIDVLREKGLRPGEDVIVISFDASRRGLELTLKGDISYDVECNPLLGYSVSDIIKQIEAGETPPKLTYVPEVSFSHDDITQGMIDSRGY